MEVTVDALSSVGFDDVDALRCYFTLVGFTLGQASYQIRGPFADLSPARHTRDSQMVSRTLPMVERWDYDAAYEFGLRLILDGVEAALPQLARAGMASGSKGEQK